LLYFTFLQWVKTPNLNNCVFLPIYSPVFYSYLAMLKRIDLIAGADRKSIKRVDQQIHTQTMKKLLMIAFVLCLSLTTKMASAQATTEDALIGRARGAAHECLNAVREPGFEFIGQSETTSICFAGGFLTTVTFYKVAVCHHEPCPRPIAVPVAEVHFGCDGQILSVTCL
jgi:hypothetical protein